MDKGLTFKIRDEKEAKRNFENVPENVPDVVPILENVDMAVHIASVKACVD